jgi:hypothetical protein
MSYTTSFNFTLITLHDCTTCEVPCCVTFSTNHLFPLLFVPNIYFRPTQRCTLSFQTELTVRSTIINKIYNLLFLRMKLKSDRIQSLSDTKSGYHWNLQNSLTALKSPAKARWKVQVVFFSLWVI